MQCGADGCSRKATTPATIQPMTTPPPCHYDLLGGETWIHRLVERIAEVSQPVHSVASTRTVRRAVLAALLAVLTTPGVVCALTIFAYAQRRDTAPDECPSEPSPCVWARMVTRVNP